jgi:hypothetical protein
MENTPFGGFGAGIRRQNCPAAVGGIHTVPQKKSPHFSIAFTDMFQKVQKFFLYRYYLPLCLVSRI